LALLFIGTCAAASIKHAPRELGILLLAATATIAIGMLIFSHGHMYAALTNWMHSTRSPRVLAFIGRTMDGFHLHLQKPSRIAACFGIALIFHGLCLAIHVIVGRTLGIQLETSVWMLVYGAVALLMLLPVSVAGLGLREGGYVGLLGLFGVAAPTALALSLVFFIFTLFGAILGWFAEMTDSERSQDL
jgi:uncharacterized membrane protein YbhN (UPF0104 family)